MTRDELIGDLKKAVEEVLPENVELDADDLSTVDTALEEVMNNAETVLTDDEEEGEGEGEKTPA